MTGRKERTTKPDEDEDNKTEDMCKQKSRGERRRWKCWRRAFATPSVSTDASKEQRRSNCSDASDVASLEPPVPSDRLSPQSWPSRSWGGGNGRNPFRFSVRSNETVLATKTASQPVRRPTAHRRPVSPNKEDTALAEPLKRPSLRRGIVAVVVPVLSGEYAGVPVARV